MAGFLVALGAAGAVVAEPPAAPAPPAATAADPLMQQVQRFADDSSRAIAPGARLEVSVGQLDPRLKLAPCEQVQPYLPAGTRLWGKAHIGVRCVRGPTLWNVYLPVTVKVYGRALVAATALSAGSVLGSADLAVAEIDLAAESGSVFSQPPQLVGRTLSRAVRPGQGLRATHLRPRQWFAAGDTVRIMAAGPGFAVRSNGQALTAGFEGQSARVRTEGGRIVNGSPVGEGEIEVSL